VRTFATRGEAVHAVQVSADQRYVIALTGASSIFVWDFNTGQLRFHRDYWRGFTVTVGVVSVLVAAWCLAWLGLAARAASSRRTVACVAVVAALLLFAVFWRHINNYPGYPLCFSAVGSVAVLLGSSALLAIGMVFGHGRVLVRLSLALAAFALLWAWPVWVWHNRPWRSSEVPLGAAIVTVLVAGLCFVAYRRGWRIVDRQSPDARTDVRFQFPLRDILLVTAAIGIVLLVSKQMSLGGNFEWWFLGFAALICLTQAVVALVALWTALSQRTLWQRLTLGLVGVAAVSALAPLAFYGAPLLPLWWYVVTQGCEAAFIFGLLMPFRIRGYRLVRSVLP
jgi:hypothetical protein